MEEKPQTPVIFSSVVGVCVDLVLAEGLGEDRDEQDGQENKSTVEVK